MSEKKNYFSELAKIDVSQYVEQKGQFSYLSWAWAVDQLLRKHPDATWDVHEYEVGGNTQPFMETQNGAFVKVSVTVNGITRSQIHPVLDFKNKAVSNPNAFDVNKAIQRGLVKAIALHGLGLYIYAGEDLPLAGPITDAQTATIQSKVQKLAVMRGAEESKIYQALGINDLGQLQEAHADILIDKLANWIAQAELKAQEEAKPAETEEAKA